MIQVGNASQASGNPEATAKTTILERRNKSQIAAEYRLPLCPAGLTDRNRADAGSSRPEEPNSQEAALTRPASSLFRPRRALRRVHACLYGRKRLRGRRGSSRNVAAVARHGRARQAACRESGRGDRVFGGKEAEKGAYPFQVALLSSDRLDDSAESQSQAQFAAAAYRAAMGADRRPTASPTRARPSTPPRW